MHSPPWSDLDGFKGVDHHYKRLTLFKVTRVQGLVAYSIIREFCHNVSGPLLVIPTFSRSLQFFEIVVWDPGIYC